MTELKCLNELSLTLKSQTLDGWMDGWMDSHL